MHLSWKGRKRQTTTFLLYAQALRGSTKTQPGELSSSKGEKAIKQEGSRKPGWLGGGGYRTSSSWASKLWNLRAVWNTACEPSLMRSVRAITRGRKFRLFKVWNRESMHVCSLCCVWELGSELICQLYCFWLCEPTKNLFAKDLHALNLTWNKPLFLKNRVHKVSLKGLFPLSLGLLNDSIIASK